MTLEDRLFADAGLLAQAIAQATDDVVFAKDLQGRYQFANPATLAVFALPLEKVLGRTDLELLPDSEVARGRMATDRRVIASGEVLETEDSMRTPDGEHRHWSTRKMPLRDAQGRLLGLLGIARDVTERKRAQARIEADRLRLQMGIEAAGLVMAEIDYRNNQNHISAELARLLELGEGEMVVPRQAIFDRIHPDDRQRYLDAIAWVLQPENGAHLAIDVRGLLPSGTVRWLHIRLQIVFSEVDGRLQPERGICAARDVTAEMLAERKLRTAQRLTESVVEGAGSLVYAKDLHGRYILSNDAWRSQFGFTRETAVGVTDDQLFGAQTAALLRANDERVLRTGEAVVVEEPVLVNGRRITYRSSKFPLYDEAGQVYAVCGVSTDITDVVEADRRKDEFIATLAHELRNPLAPIRNGLEILRRLEALPPAANRTRDMMDRQLRHLVRLVDDLLDVSRISRDRLELRMADTTLAEVVAHALETTQPAIEAAGHQLSSQLPAGPVRLRGDLTRLAQVVSNLLNNAAKYTDRGGHVRLRAWADDGEAFIEVADDGAGISAAMLPHVFELFAQDEGTRSQAQGGLGIGLWLVRKLVELHHGHVIARSDGPGCGSTFTVCLPRVVE